MSQIKYFKIPIYVVSIILIGAILGMYLNSATQILESFSEIEKSDKKESSLEDIFQHNDVIPKIYVIRDGYQKKNVDNISSTLDKMNLDWRFFDGPLVDKPTVRSGYHVKESELKRIQYHRTLFKLCRDLNETIIVLEADALLNLNFKDVIESKLGVFGNRKEWELLQFTNCGETNETSQNFMARFTFNAITCMAGYGVKPNLAKWLYRKTCVVDGSLENTIQRLSQDGVIQTSQTEQPIAIRIKSEQLLTNILYNEN